MHLFLSVLDWGCDLTSCLESCLDSQLDMAWEESLNKNPAATTTNDGL